MRAEGIIWAREGGWNTQDAVCGRIPLTTACGGSSPQGEASASAMLGGASRIRREQATRPTRKSVFERSRACIGLVEAPLTVAEELALIGGLSRTVSRLVDTFNRRIGDDFLYFTTCAGTFTLSAKRVDACDCRLANGILDVPVLVKMILTLQRAVEIEKEYE